MSQPTSREEQRDRLLEAALVHVPFDGWSRRSLLAGAADLGLEPGRARRLFPRAGDDLLVQVERWADRRMLERAGPLEALRVRERIAKLPLHFLHRLPALQAFVDEPTELHRDLVARGHVRREGVEHARDVFLCGHDLLSLSWSSNSAIAPANRVHSRVSSASSARPASVSA